MALWDKLSNKMKETIVKGATLAGLTVTTITSVGAGVEQQKQLDQMGDHDRDPVSVERLMQDAPIKTSMEAFNEMDDLMGQSERQQEVQEATDPRQKTAVAAAGTDGPKGSGAGTPGGNPGPAQEGSGDYYFTGTARANVKHGSGGIQQYFIQNAYEMKKEHPAAGNGRLIEVDREYEAPGLARVNGLPDGVTSHQFGSTHATVDSRPLTEEEQAEMAQLEASTPMEEGQSIQSLDVEENPDTAYLDENTIDARGLNRLGANVGKQAWIRPFSNQEDDKLDPDAWKNPEQLQDGQVFYQLSVDGDTTSSYFVTQDVIDSCRKADGSLDFNQLRDGLQIPQGEQKTCLTKYVYRAGQGQSAEEHYNKGQDGDDKIKDVSQDETKNHKTDLKQTDKSEHVETNPDQKHKTSVNQTDLTEDQNTEKQNEKSGLPMVQTNSGPPAVWEKPTANQETNSAGKTGTVTQDETENHDQNQDDKIKDVSQDETKNHKTDLKQTGKSEHVETNPDQKHKTSVNQTDLTEDQNTEKQNEKSGLPMVQTNSGPPAVWEKPTVNQETNSAGKTGTVTQDETENHGQNQDDKIKDVSQDETKNRKTDLKQTDKSQHVETNSDQKHKTGVNQTDLTEDQNTEKQNEKSGLPMVQTNSGPPAVWNGSRNNNSSHSSDGQNRDDDGGYHL